MSNLNIKEIQVLLNNIGFLLTPDGIIGPKTTNAIKSFQEMQVLPQTGIADEKTIAALIKFSEAINPKPVGELKPITDQPTLDKIAKLHPSIRDKVTQAIQKANARLTGRAQVRIVQGLRTFAEQDALYAQRPKVTNAKGGQSIHNYGAAVDFALLIDGKQISWDTTKDFDGDGAADWMEVVKAFEEEGGLWGGKWSSFVDLPHIEWVHEWRPLLEKYKRGEFIQGTKYVIL